MLDKFNKLFQKIIFEQVEDQEATDKYIQSINDCDAFFRAYILPLAEKLEINAVKARYNTFRLFGTLDLIIKFFNDFKVDKQFLPEKEKFLVLNPMISFCENTHSYNKIPSHVGGVLPAMGTEGETLNTGDDNTLDTFRNNINQYVISRWIDILNYNEVKADDAKGEEVKYADPKTIAKSLNTYIKDNKLETNVPCFIEFMVNVDKLPLNSYEELAKAVPIDNIKTGETLSDVINTRPDVVNPKPNQGVLGTIDTSKEPSIMKEVKASKKPKTKKSDFNKKNKVK